jgi:hypothetical protein
MGEGVEALGEERQDREEWFFGILEIGGSSY